MSVAARQRPLALASLPPPTHSGVMFIPFFLELKAAKVPVSLREYLTLLESLEAD